MLNLQEHAGPYFLFCAKAPTSIASLPSVAHFEKKQEVNRLTK